jgi:hypothetical protein
MDCEDRGWMEVTVFKGEEALVPGVLNLRFRLLLCLRNAW